MIEDVGRGKVLLLKWSEDVAFPQGVWENVGRMYIAAKGPIATDDFVDMGASARVEIGATVFGAEVGAGQFYWGG